MRAQASALGLVVVQLAVDGENQAGRALAVGRQQQRLTTGVKIDDREPRVPHGQAAGGVQVHAATVGPSVVKQVQHALNVLLNGFKFFFGTIRCTRIARSCRFPSFVS